MSKPIISVENLSKAYRIGLKEEIHDTMMSALIGAVKAPFKNFRRLSRLDAARANGDEEADTIWPLKDVSFDVQEGEVLGIIGRNGAGKSTLLKILSRITEPTAGRIVLRGRVSSLLEVGTGFHPELTGRENVYMNGTILGMKKREIDRKFDEIVDFSGVEKFLDTPVKRYSSGMQVRLAFAVAAHLEPEILIVDEVLAVGDAAFQWKCLGKLQDVASGGRTVLFVSHNMAPVQNLCTSAMFLRNGGIHLRDNAIRVIDEYVKTIKAKGGSSFDLSCRPRKHSAYERAFREIRFLDEDNRPTHSYAPGQNIVIELDLFLGSASESPPIAIGIDDCIGQRICSVATYLSASQLPRLSGSVTLRCVIQGLPLSPGIYPLSMSIGRPIRDQVEDVVALQIHAEDFLGNGTVPDRSLGQILARSEWYSTVARSSTNNAALVEK